MVSLPCVTCQMVLTLQGKTQHWFVSFITRQTNDQFSRALEARDISEAVSFLSLGLLVCRSLGVTHFLQLQSLSPKFTNLHISFINFQAVIITTTELLQCEGMVLSCSCLVAKVCSTLFATPWTVAHQAPLFMKFPRQEYWSWLPFPSPRDLPKPGIEPASPALAGRFFTTESAGKPVVLSTLDILFHLMLWRLL